jgi:DnaJ-domain-containing protein 1
MKATELIVIVLGALLGYWIVSLLFKAKPPAPPFDAPAEPSPAADSPTVHAWYQVLGVAPQASPDEIRSAYKVLISQYHPDKVASLGIELQVLAESKSKAIGAAYREGMQSHGLEP